MTGKFPSAENQTSIGTHVWVSTEKRLRGPFMPVDGQASQKKD